MKHTSKAILAIAAAALLVITLPILWQKYSRRGLKLDMDMCDGNGNVVHVTVDAVLRRKFSGDFTLEGEIFLDGKLFVNDRYDEDRLVTAEFANSGEWSWPGEWISSFSAADREDGTYYFLVYQTRGEDGDGDHWEAREDNTFHYFGPAATKEEAEKIRAAWIQRK